MGRGRVLFLFFFLGQMGHLLPDTSELIEKRTLLIACWESAGFTAKALDVLMDAIEKSGHKDKVLLASEDTFSMPVTTCASMKTNLSGEDWNRCGCI